MTLMVVMISRVYAHPKFIKFYALNMYGFLYANCALNGSIFNDNKIQSTIEIDTQLQPDFFKRRETNAVKKEIVLDLEKSEDETWKQSEKFKKRKYADPIKDCVVIFPLNGESKLQHQFGDVIWD